MRVWPPADDKPARRRTGGEPARNRDAGLCRFIQRGVVYDTATYGDRRPTVRNNIVCVCVSADSGRRRLFVFGPTSGGRADRVRCGARSARCCRSPCPVYRANPNFDARTTIDIPATIAFTLTFLDPSGNRSREVRTLFSVQFFTNARVPFASNVHLENLRAHNQTAGLSNPRRSLFLYPRTIGLLDVSRNLTSSSFGRSIDRKRNRRVFVGARQTTGDIVVVAPSRVNRYNTAVVNRK